MRGLIAYILAFLILLNIGGYHALFLAIQVNFSGKLLKNLDDNSINPEEIKLVKVPLTLPYASDSKDFERVDGKFEFEGKVYRLVKQKLYKDTLHVVILEDKIGSYINKAKTDFAKSFADQPLEERNSSNSKIFKLLKKDFLYNNLSLETASKGWYTTNQSIKYLNIYSFQISSLLFIPPEISTLT